MKPQLFATFFILWSIISCPGFAAGTMMQRIQKLPVIPPVNESPFNRFDKYDGAWNLQSDGSITVKAAMGPKLVLNDPEHAQMATGKVSVGIFFADRTSGVAGLITKVSDCDVGADNFNGYEIAINPEKNVLLLGAHRHNFHSIREIPLNIPTGKWIELAVDFTETAFVVSVDGKRIDSFTEQNMSDSDPLRCGTVGLRNWTRDVSFRNLELNGNTIAFELKERKTNAITTGFPETLSTENLPPIALVLRYPLSSPYSVGLDLWQPQPSKYGCEIHIIDPANPENEPCTIFSDPDGCIYDMNVSFDAKTLLFSYRKSSEKYWHIWKINVDGTNLQQLTDGEFYDVSPCELPDGDIIFVSTRRFGHTVCQPGPASNLFRMKPDGSGITCMSMNTLSDFSPQILPDGRVLFTRWEYIDRDLTYRQSLWTQNPDGTSYQLYFGNTIRDVGTFWQARPIPGRSNRVVATFAPHHGFPHGAIGVIDRSFGVEAEKNLGFSYITKDFPVIADHSREWSYRDPFPLSEDSFLCSFGSDGPSIFETKNNEPRFRIYMLNSLGEKRLLYEDESKSCFFPTPLISQQRPPLISPKTETDETQFGTVLLVDVYKGIEDVIPRGSVKSIRMMEQIRKTEDLTHRAYDQSPVMSYGTYYAKRNHGTVPVESDGSAYFKVPALREIYFQILDEDGRELHRMTSAVQLMPGETVGCIGCHESRDTTPPTTGTQKLPIAAARSASLAQLPEWMQTLPETTRTNKLLDPGIVDYPSVVQPVLDRYCIDCHDGSNPAGGYNLSGDKTRFFNMSYDNLLGKSKSYRQHDMQTGDLTPQAAALGKPLVHFYWLLWTPTAVHRPFQSGSFASRLPEFLESGHSGKMIPLEDRQRIYLWIDANVPYYGTYANSHPNSAGLRDLWTEPTTGQMASWFKDDFLEVYKNNCESCHGSLETQIDWEGRYSWINLTRPEFSSAITAHLSKGSGGRGVDGFEFKSKEEPNYRKILAAIKQGKELAEKTPEADMQGFRGMKVEP